MYFCSVIIPSRDGEAHLETTLTSLLNQDVRVAITVIDDHSIDGAPAILEEYSQVTVIRNPIREPKGHERIGGLLNMGRASMPPARFYMISGDDTRFPRDYIRRVTDSMILDGVACASGHARKYSPTGAPDGSGRIYTAELWDRLMPFIESSGWESGMMHKARWMGYTLKKYPVKKEHLRPYSGAGKRNDGYASWTLGNPLIWCVLRVLKAIWVKTMTPAQGFQILSGHLEYQLKGKPKVEFADRLRAERMTRIRRGVIYMLIVKPGRRIKAWLDV